MSEIRGTVVRVLSGQQASYFIYPNAAAFAAEGLDAHDVLAELEALEGAGIAEREQMEVITKASQDVLAELPRRKRLAHRAKGTQPEPEIALIPGGWRIRAEHRLDLSRS